MGLVLVTIVSRSALMVVEDKARTQQTARMLVIRDLMVWADCLMCASCQKVFG